MTAVQWLVNQIFSEHTAQWQNEINQALQMEQEQIISAFSNGWHDGQDIIIDSIAHVDKGGDDAGLDYYNLLK